MQMYVECVYSILSLVGNTGCKPAGRSCPELDNPQKYAWLKKTMLWGTAEKMRYSCFHLTNKLLYQAESCFRQLIRKCRKP